MTPQEKREWITDVYEMRRTRAVNPEGEIDDGSRWHPSKRENPDGSVNQCRSPSRAWPYSYLVHCRTRKHCRVLVEAALAGKDVPDDVWECCPMRARFTHDTPIAIVRDYVLEGCPTL
jgi:hypothetical protein